MFCGKPIIGLAGGIGSGKSFVAGLFAELGAFVISSDQQVQQLYEQENVKDTLRSWWGPRVFRPDGSVDRSAVAGIVFSDPAEKARLEGFLHPLVNAARLKIMQEKAADPAVKAFVWDIPLLFEANLNKQCDCIVFIDAPLWIRQQRVRQTRGWSAEELAKRENLQLPLDKKRAISDYMISNSGDAGVVREQVRDVLSRILSVAQGQVGKAEAEAR
ncbi:MAG: dephospho-CoA kinase [Phycisphaerae bacterium]|nr:dephospho-CoA kinase [Phycisphaerae bacterium]MDW8262985.1 dephospho-CoA kinase [Phycisphaerales bacterium]